MVIRVPLASSVTNSVSVKVTMVCVPVSDLPLKGFVVEFEQGEVFKMVRAH